MLQALLFALLLSDQGSGTTAVESESLQITETLIPLTTESAMLQRCNAPRGSIHGCTHFVGDTLSTGCSRRGAVWSVEIRARLQALIFVADLAYADHEKRHVRDMRDAIDAFLAQEEAVAYPSEQTCKAAAAETVQQFRSRMRTMAAASNAWRN